MDKRKKPRKYLTLRTVMFMSQISQAKLAEALGITQSAVSRKINGYSHFTIQECDVIKKTLQTDLSIDELFS